MGLLQSATTGDGWGPYAQSPPEPFDTALALLALARLAPTPEIPALIRTGRSYLISSQSFDGGWPATTRPAARPATPSASRPPAGPRSLLATAPESGRFDQTNPIAAVLVGWVSRACKAQPTVLVVNYADPTAGRFDQTNLNPDSRDWVRSAAMGCRLCSLPSSTIE